MKRTSISIVIPVFNSAQTLEALVQRLSGALSPLGVLYEIILVNDGSGDGSWERIVSLSHGHRTLRGIKMMRNYGQHNALLAGIRQARYSTVVTLDDDLQNPPEEIPKLIAKLQEGYDVVYGFPDQEQHGLWRDLASQVTKLALHATMGATSARGASAFRAFRTDIRDSFANYSGPHVSIDVLLTWGAARFAAISVRHDPRMSGKSNYTFRKLVRHALNMVTGFSTIPLQLASLVGFGFSILGLSILSYVLGRYFVEGGSVPGFPFLASIVAIFAGAQMFALGIIGEYLARMYLRTMDRPTYTVESVTGQDAGCQGISDSE